jgi:hypothetical protein
MGPEILGALCFLSLPVAFIVCLCGLISKLSPEERAKEEAKVQAKRVMDAKIICPQCREKGWVTTRPIQERAGIDGGKATAALLTGGLSILGTGLSNVVARTEASCGNCGSSWRF